MPIRQLACGPINRDFRPIVLVSVDGMQAGGCTGAHPYSRGWTAGRSWDAEASRCRTTSERPVAAASRMGGLPQQELVLGSSPLGLSSFCKGSGSSRDVTLGERGEPCGWEVSSDPDDPDVLGVPKVKRWLRSGDMSPAVVREGGVCR